MRSILCLLCYLLISLPAGAQRRAPDNTVVLGFFRERRYLEAAAYLESFRDSARPGDPVLSTLGYAYYMGGELRQAARCFETLYAADSSDLAACQYLGDISLASGDKTRALDYFCRLSELKPDVAAYNKQLAVLWTKLGNGDASWYYYRLAYRAAPGDPETVAGLAGCLIEQDLYKKADSILDAYLSRDSLQTAILETRVTSAFFQKDYRRIFPLTGKLLQMQSVSLEPFLCAAYAHYFLHQYQEAENTCALLILHNLKTRTVLYLMALCYREQHKYQLSLLTLDECISDALSKDAVTYLSEKGSIDEALSRPREALREYDTAYYIFRDPVALYQKAGIYDRLKQYGTALSYYRRYREARRDTVIPAEEKALEYATKRIGELSRWQKQQP